MEKKETRKKNIESPETRIKETIGTEKFSGWFRKVSVEEFF